MGMQLLLPFRNTVDECCGNYLPFKDLPVEQHLHGRSGTRLPSSVVTGRAPEALGARPRDHLPLSASRCEG
jgi:hypothetical protein